MSEPRQQGLGGEASSLGRDFTDCVSGLLNAVDKGLASELSDYDLAVQEFFLLQLCQEMDECTATQLAQILPTDPSRISRIVTRMVNEGYLLRRRLPEDRRVVMLRLTEEGRQLTDRAARRAESCIKALTQGISREDLNVFLATGFRIIANYEASAQARPGAEE